VAELALARGDQRATVSTTGGRLADYRVAGRAVVVGDEPPGTRAYRNALLAPWPNRVAQGRWSWRGRTFQLGVNEPERDTALHGLVAYEPFQVVSHDEERVELAHDLSPSPGYPFSLRVEVDYRLTDGGLRSVLRARNTGTEDAPVALGVHPYVDTRGLVDETVLQLPARTLLVTDDAWQETDRVPVEQTELDFRTPRRVGPDAMDACFTNVRHGADGVVRATVGLPGGDTVSIWGGPTTRCFVVYNADTLRGTAYRRSIAVEPCTAPANALRSGIDLDVIAPGATFELEWGVQPSWLA
jgi:aldose 1-epimerase